MCCFGGLLPTAAAQQGEEKQREASTKNLKKIVLALHEFADNHKHWLPPAAICNKKGKPLLSWRVAILPQLGYQNLYEQFKLDEPWDSEHNKKLLEKMPKVYAPVGAKPK